MNNNLKENINTAYKRIILFVSNLIQLGTSILRIIVLSKINVAHKSKLYVKIRENNKCIVLGNGPSLKLALENNEVHFASSDIFCVNMFCQSEYFTKLKPRFYCLIDGDFFAPKDERCIAQVKILIDALKCVNWKMYLVIPADCTDGNLLCEVKSNSNILIIRVNSAEVNGFKGFRHFIYKHRLGMPRCQTVANFALCTAVNMKYNNIYLYGADHSWTKDLRVDDDNVVCYGDRHVYATNLEYIRINYSIATLLRNFANMFESHWIINEFAKSMNIKIFNCTKGSFVDAYDRKY